MPVLMCCKQKHEILGGECLSTDLQSLPRLSSFYDLSLTNYYQDVVVITCLGAKRKTKLRF